MYRSQRKKYGFTKTFRLNQKKEINRLFQSGKFQSFGFLKFRYLPQSHGHIRVVISISKRVGKAPSRNRLKRLIRESLRTSGYLQTRSLDCAIFVTKPLQQKPALKDIRHYLLQFLGNLPDDCKTKDQSSHQ